MILCEFNNFDYKHEHAYAGGDLHYHLTQRGTFTEDEVRFYGAEILLGLEHMHYHNIVYRDLKVSLSFIYVFIFFISLIVLTQMSLLCDIEITVK